MKLLLIINSLFLLSVNSFAQDHEQETQYSFLQSTIKKNKIKSITEYRACNKDKKEISSKHEFDSKGRLIKIYDFYYGDSIPSRMTFYEPNVEDFKTKSWILYDTTGKIEYAMKWKFLYDAKGRRIKADLVYKDSKATSYTYRYDDKNNIIEETKDSIMCWFFEYDSENRLIKRLDLNHFSMKPGGPEIVYSYNENGLITQEIERNPDDTSDIYNSKSYNYNVYDKLISLDERKAHWKSINNSEPVKEFTVYHHKYNYDDAGNLIRLEMNDDKHEKPLRCYSYIYEFY